MRNEELQFKYCQIILSGLKVNLKLGPDLVPGERFLRNIYTGNDFDILINVHSGKYKLPGNAVKVFDAPYVEEINGIRIKKSDKFWSVHKHNNDLFIKSVFPLSSEKKSCSP